MTDLEFIDDILNRINSIKEGKEINKFKLLKDIIFLFNSEGYSKNLQRVLFFLLENKTYFTEYREIINSLLREIGLFPYIDNNEVNNIRDKIAINSFVAPPISPTKVIFHFPQAKVFYTIMSGKNVILSAPTSFGKSLLIDALIATKKFCNIVIVVPTIALIDETRKRLSKFNKYYKIITHKSQEKSQNNIYILTQERVVIDDFIDEVDFFIIDEFYKLNPSIPGGDDIRCNILNLAFYKLYKKCKHFYMLGPNIDGIVKDVEDSISFIFMKEEFPTVGTNIHYESTAPSAKTIFSIFTETKDPTLVYCKSPQSVIKLAKDILPYKKDVKNNRDIAALCKWIASTYHSKWSIIPCLEHGIGIHHAKLPRALAQYIIELFNNRNLDILFCTSTIIEGVNTSAKNVILSENKIGTNDLDFFTFNNIIGRAGRMFKYFIGNIYVFNDIPSPTNEFIDIPTISQPEDTPLNILLNMETEDLNDNSKHRILKFNQENTILSIQTIVKSPYVSPEMQINLAKDILANAHKWHKLLNWSQEPSYIQLKFICKLMFEYFNAKNLSYRSVSSPDQLAYKINMLKSKLPIKDMILQELEYVVKNKINKDIDNVIMDLLNFIRMWANNHFPRLLMTISCIQEEIFAKLELSFGNYSFYALNVESLFFDPALICLEEYGIPLEISRKFQNLISKNGNLDLTIKALKNLDWNRTPLEFSEKIFMRRAMKYL